MLLLASQKSSEEGKPEVRAAGSRESSKVEKKKKGEKSVNFHIRECECLYSRLKSNPFYHCY